MRLAEQHPRDLRAPPHDGQDHHCPGRGTGRRRWRRAGHGVRHAVRRDRKGRLQQHGGAPRDGSGGRRLAIHATLRRAIASIGIDPGRHRSRRRDGRALGRWEPRAPPEEIDAFVAATAHRIASCPADAVRLTKQAVDAAAKPLEDGLREESFRFQQLMASVDSIANIKRVPRPGRRDTSRREAPRGPARRSHREIQRVTGLTRPGTAVRIGATSRRNPREEQR